MDPLIQSFDLDTYSSRDAIYEMLLIDILALFKRSQAYGLL